MIKRLIQHFKKRKEMKLRKWCMKMAADTSDIHHSEMYSAANKIYEWVNGIPESKT